MALYNCMINVDMIPLTYTENYRISANNNLEPPSYNIIMFIVV
jgi:hypothetical protein